MVIKPDDLHWRPSNLMKIPNADYLERTGSENLGARLWRLPPKARTPCTNISALRNFISFWKARAACASAMKHSGCPNTEACWFAGSITQVFDDTDDEVLWLMVGAPEELEFLQGSKSKIDLSMIYPIDPKQLSEDSAV